MVRRTIALAAETLAPALDASFLDEALENFGVGLVDVHLGDLSYVTNGLGIFFWR